MTDHDQFFKHLLREFFGDLVQIVAPDLAPHLRLSDPTFLESELFTDFPEGARRSVDLVARVESVDGEPEVVLVHVEVERQARRAIAHRLLDYSLQLWLRDHVPVVPIVLYLRGGEPGVHLETVEMDIFGHRFFQYSFLALGLSRSRAADFLERSEPLAWGLAGLMRRGRMSPARHKLSCLEAIAAAEQLTDKQRFLLANCVETYVEWNEAAQAEFETLVAAEGKDHVAIMEMTWAGRIRQEGLEAGRIEGLQEGRQEGILEGRRELLLALLEDRFGPLASRTRERVAKLDGEALSRLATDLLDAASLDDLGL